MPNIGSVALKLSRSNGAGFGISTILRGVAERGRSDPGVGAGAGEGDDE
jgi:hypothetical protein